MTYRHIEATPISGALGALITGADLSQLNDDVFQDIHQAFHRKIGTLFAGIKSFSKHRSLHRKVVATKV